MEEKVTLIYRINEKKIILKEGTLFQIDSLTRQFENEFKLNIFFRNEIKKLREKCYKPEKKGEFVIIDEEENEIKLIYKDYEELFHALINDEKFLTFLDRNYEKYHLYFPDEEKYSLYDEKTRKKTIEIYRKEYKGKVKISKEEQEKKFIGNLLDTQKVKKLGGM